MSKYAHLGEYLKKQPGERVPMTFAQIERVIGAKLPASARYRAWWSNNDFNSVMTKVWKEAGFESEQVDMSGRKLVFRRIQPSSRTAASGKGKPFHPLAGLLKEVTHVPDETDLTAPADPEWGKR